MHAFLLRVSGQISGNEYDLTAIARDEAGESGVPHGSTLVAYADAVLGGDDVALSHARERLLQELGAEALVDAAAVVATFAMVDRIADATGIPLDGKVELMTQGIRSEVGADAFASASNTPRPGLLRRAIGRVLAIFLPMGFRLMRAIRR
ncbi:MAG: hypothetical protein AB1603_05610 [Chloroflexota bacterium]